ncbi:MAG: hypothetical protein JWR03_422 [Cohnella sp.]|nr:hypothetical protein [Cohnella sp.]
MNEIADTSPEPERKVTPQLESPQPLVSAEVSDVKAESEKKSTNSLEPLISLQKEAERQAISEEIGQRTRAIVIDFDRVHRRSSIIEADLAPKRLSPTELERWNEWRSNRIVPSAAMLKGIHAERRLAPEATMFEERMEAVLLKYANVPLGHHRKMVLPQYFNALDVAAESVEQAAYPGTVDARKRYALALRRCARDLRLDSYESDENSAGNAKWRARMTLRLALNDGTLRLWDSEQELVDFVGRQSYGTTQDASLVSQSAWMFIWDYAVVSLLRKMRPQRFKDLPDLRPYRADESGRILDARSNPIAWIWDGLGSGLLESDAARNEAADRQLESAMKATGMDVLFASSDRTVDYRQSPQYPAFRQQIAVIEDGTGAAACEALADLLEAELGAGQSVPLKQKRIVIEPQAPSLKSGSEATVEADTYQTILEVIHQLGVSMERHPSTYQGKDEEALRDLFLMQLSPHFQSVTGETFNAAGKTDILIRHEKANVFVAECKFWRGLKGKDGYFSAIEQILSYLTWRDSKAAILLFVQRKELEPVLQKIAENTNHAPSFVTDLGQKQDGWFQYEFHIKDDPTRTVHLAVMCFHFPRETERDAEAID